MAAQLFEAACRAEPGIPDDLRTADFSRLVAWLRAKVHAKASLLSTEELLVEATGQPLDACTFRAHLRRRYVERTSAE
jgi:carboxypeptidase Taq